GNEITIRISAEIPKIKIRCVEQSLFLTAIGFKSEQSCNVVCFERIQPFGAMGRPASSADGDTHFGGVLLRCTPNQATRSEFRARPFSFPGISLAQLNRALSDVAAECASTALGFTFSPLIYNFHGDRYAKFMVVIES